MQGTYTLKQLLQREARFELEGDSVLFRSVIEGTSKFVRFSHGEKVCSDGEKNFGFTISWMLYTIIRYHCSIPVSNVTFAQALRLFPPSTYERLVASFCKQHDFRPYDAERAESIIKNAHIAMYYTDDRVEKMRRLLLGLAPVRNEESSCPGVVVSSGRSYREASTHIRSGMMNAEETLPLKVSPRKRGSGVKIKTR